MTAQPLTINLNEGSVTFSFTPQSAQDLQRVIAELMESLKTVAATVTPGSGASGKVTPQKNVEYRHTGDVFLEMFCNPNIWPTPFAAKVLLTIRDDRIRLTTELELSRLREDLNQYLEQFS